MPEHSYENQTFRSVDLNGKCLKNCFFENIIFEHCHFITSDWQEAQFLDCQFKQCNLSLIHLIGVRLQHIIFEECKIVGLDFYRCRKLQNVSFHSSILQTCNFSNLKLSHTSFKKSKIREVHFSHTDLSETSFIETDLTGSIFHQCNLSNADFRNAKNYTIDIKTNNVKNASFSLPDALVLLDAFEIHLS